VQPDEIQLRRYPYPYRAMLSVCSDLDGTPDRRAYERIARFCNTSEPTAMGDGVGLEIGNSIYFDMPPDQFAYWTTDDAGRAMVRAMIHSGHIDCLHSYGDLATTRDDARRALEELDRHGCRLRVWVDHGAAPTNLDGGIMRGHGDQVDHPAYHADLTVAHGVRYVWRGRVTSVTGQGVRSRLTGIWTPRHPGGSARTLATEAAKHALSRCGSRKYAMHAPNRVLRRVTLRDGRPAWEFLRSNPHYGGVSSAETAGGIAGVLTEHMLSRLVSREGVCILYTHLGKVDDPACPFDPAVVEALRRLSAEAAHGKILVATTRRTLDYLRMRDSLQFHTRCERDRSCVDVQLDDGVDPAAAAGLTFYHTRYVATEVRINGEPVAHLRVNPPDHTGRPSVSVPWPRLEFPQW